VGIDLMTNRKKRKKTVRTSTRAAQSADMIQEGDKRASSIQGYLREEDEEVMLTPMTELYQNVAQ